MNFAGSHFTPDKSVSLANAVCVNVGKIIAEDLAVATGDAVRCTCCGAVFSHADSVAADGAWVCLFCATRNPLQDGEPPVAGKTQTFALPLAEDDAAERPVAKAKAIVLCIDISGSMGMTKQVGGRHVSRLEAVQAGVIEMLAELKKASPDVRIGLCTFNNKVSLYDGTSSSERRTIAGDTPLEKLLELGSSIEFKYTAGEDHDMLVDQVKSLTETGSTALGPALAVASASAAEMGAGSQVMVCTDGVANVGVGSLDRSKGAEAQEFYEHMAAFCRRKGVVVSVMSVKGTKTRLEQLGQMAEATSGHVDLIDFGTVASTLATAVGAEVVATQATLAIHVQAPLRLPAPRSNAEERISDRKMAVPLGIVVKDQEFGIEVELDSGSSAEAVLLQAVIEYTTTDGERRMRVFTQSMPISEDGKSVSVNVDVLSSAVAQRVSRLARAGDFAGARAQALEIREQLGRMQISEDQAHLVEQTYSVTEAAAQRMESEQLCQSSLRDTSNMDDGTAAMMYQMQGAKKSACVVS